MEKPDSAKNGLNNVKHEGKATLWSMVEIKIQLSQAHTDSLTIGHLILN